MVTFHAPDTPNLRLFIPSLSRTIEFTDGEYRTTHDGEIVWLRRNPRFEEQSPDPEPTRDELYQRAQELEVDGRTKMSKDELAAAVQAAQVEAATAGD